MEGLRKNHFEKVLSTRKILGLHKKNVLYDHPLRGMMIINIESNSIYKILNVVKKYVQGGYANYVEIMAINKTNPCESLFSIPWENETHEIGSPVLYEIEKIHNKNKLVVSLG